MFTLLLLLRIQCCMWRNQWITSRHGLDSDRNLYFKQDLVLNLYYILHIGAGAGKFLGVWRIFDRKIFGQLVLLSPNKRIPFFEVQLREKSSTHVVCCFFKILHTWVPFFEIKQHWAPFVPVFSGSLPRFSGILQRFSQILLRFPLFLLRFSGIFPGFSTNQNFLGALAPPDSRPLHHWFCNIIFDWIWITKNINHFFWKRLK